MNRRHMLLLMATLPVAALSSSTLAQTLNDLTGAVKDPMIAMLTGKLGVTESQAKGGMGSMLTLAKEKLASGDFSKLTSLMPQAAKYMDTAKQLGAVTGPLKNKAGLNGALAKLGMNSDTVNKFVPLVTDYVAKIGGESAKNLLLSVFK